MGYWFYKSQLIKKMSLFVTFLFQYLLTYKRFVCVLLKALHFVAYQTSSCIQLFLPFMEIPKFPWSTLGIHSTVETGRDVLGKCVYVCVKTVQQQLVATSLLVVMAESRRRQVAADNVIFYYCSVCSTQVQVFVILCSIHEVNQSNRNSTD